jgi:hypothetical protein
MLFNNLQELRETRGHRDKEYWATTGKKIDSAVFFSSFPTVLSVHIVLLSFFLAGHPPPIPSMMKSLQVRIRSDNSFRTVINL